MLRTDFSRNYNSIGNYISSLRNDIRSLGILFSALKEFKFYSENNWWILLLHDEHTRNCIIHVIIFVVEQILTLP